MHVWIFIVADFDVVDSDCFLSILSDYADFTVNDSAVAYSALSEFAPYDSAISE